MGTPVAIALTLTLSHGERGLYAPVNPFRETQRGVGLNAFLDTAVEIDQCRN